MMRISQLTDYHRILTKKVINQINKYSHRTISIQTVEIVSWVNNTIKKMISNKKAVDFHLSAQAILIMIKRITIIAIICKTQQAQNGKHTNKEVCLSFMKFHRGSSPIWCNHPEHTKLIVFVNWNYKMIINVHL